MRLLTVCTADIGCVVDAAAAAATAIFVVSFHFYFLFSGVRWPTFSRLHDDKQYKDKDVHFVHLLCNCYPQPFSLLGSVHTQTHTHTMRHRHYQCQRQELHYSRIGLLWREHTTTAYQRNHRLTHVMA